MLDSMNIEYDEIIDMLPEGGVSNQYPIYLYIFFRYLAKLRNCIASEGWGLKLLSLLYEKGQWIKKIINPNGYSLIIHCLTLKTAGFYQRFLISEFPFPCY
jgi:hypothetical protein